MAAALPSSWEELPPDLLGLVLLRLLSHADRVLLRAVCRPWRAGAAAQRLPPPLPWLALRDGSLVDLHGAPVRCAPIVREGAFSYLAVDNLAFLVHDDGGCSLLKPLSGQTLHLPELAAAVRRALDESKAARTGVRYRFLQEAGSGKTPASASATPSAKQAEAVASAIPSGGSGRPVNGRGVGPACGSVVRAGSRKGERGGLAAAERVEPAWGGRGRRRRSAWPAWPPPSSGTAGAGREGPAPGAAAEGGRGGAGGGGLHGGEEAGAGAASPWGAALLLGGRAASPPPPPPRPHAPPSAAARPPAHHRPPLPGLPRASPASLACAASPETRGRRRREREGGGGGRRREEEEGTRETRTRIRSRERAARPAGTGGRQGEADGAGGGGRHERCPRFGGVSAGGAGRAVVGGARHGGGGGGRPAVARHGGGGGGRRRAGGRRAGGGVRRSAGGGRAARADGRLRVALLDFAATAAFPPADSALPWPGGGAPARPRSPLSLCSLFPAPSSAPSPGALARRLGRRGPHTRWRSHWETAIRSGTERLRFGAILSSPLDAASDPLLAFIIMEGSSVAISACKQHDAISISMRPKRTRNTPRIRPIGVSMCPEPERPQGPRRIDDIAFLHAKLYALTRHEGLRVIDLDADRLSEPTPSSGFHQWIPDDPKQQEVYNYGDDPGYLVMRYLTQSNGRLWMIRRWMSVPLNARLGDHDRTFRFEVFEADLATVPGRWTKADSLGGHAIFLGTECSKAVLASQCADGVQADCIYFMHRVYDNPSKEFFGPCVDPLGDSGVYNMADGGITPLLPEAVMAELRRKQQFLTWFFPADA
ncbi:hypothetical protein ACP70R_015892 [Stipagrostis hirtigluma subsp. patula]